MHHRRTVQSYVRPIRTVIDRWPRRDPRCRLPNHFCALCRALRQTVFRLGIAVEAHRSHPGDAQVWILHLSAFCFKACSYLHRYPEDDRSDRDWNRDRNGAAQVALQVDETLVAGIFTLLADNRLLYPRHRASEHGRSRRTVAGDYLYPVAMHGDFAPTPRDMRPARLAS